MSASFSERISVDESIALEALSSHWIHCGRGDCDGDAGIAAATGTGDRAVRVRAELMRQSGHTREEVVRDALREFVSDYQLAESASEELQAFRKGRTETVPWEQVKRDLGLER